MKVLKIILIVIVALCASYGIFSFFSSLIYRIRYAYAKKIVADTKNNKYIEILKCPYCGGNFAELSETEDGFSVICDSSEGGCGSGTGYFTEETNAIEAWNTRNGIIESYWQDMEEADL